MESTGTAIPGRTPAEGSDCVLALVKTAAKRKRALFRPFPDFDPDDLEQEGMLAVREALGDFDPDKGRQSTFVYTVASRRMIDLWRVRSRRHDRERHAACSPVLGPPAPFAGDEDLADWCATVYRTCRRLYPEPIQRLGRKFYKLHQAAAVLLFMRRLGLDAHRARHMLAGRPDLRHALRLVHTPGREFFEGIIKLARRKGLLAEDGTVAMTAN